ncbi:MAG: hypothetical protein K2G23_03725, partial [Muribaculaceae bacterium]|nr:hypothetical protein [Muribaculaceae bacterium]
MISFVNAKINLGLQIVRKREDGYHDLQTVFYPVGKYAGTAQNHVKFCDILEVTGRLRRGNPSLPSFKFRGRTIDCPLEKNLIYKAADLFCREMRLDLTEAVISLEKNLPDGAGMGGGSADAGFVLRALANLAGSEPGCPEIDERTLAAMALRLGAD